MNNFELIYFMRGRFKRFVTFLGMITFSDGSHGFPKNEGFFQDCKLVRKKRCPEVVQRAQKVALMARAQADQNQS